MIANIYIDEMKNITKVRVPRINSLVKHAYHLFVIQHPERDKLKECLKLEEIETGIHYPVALPKLQAFNYIDNNYNEFVACQIDKNLLSLPIGEHVSVDDAKRIVNLIRNL
jgi:dTDP-4-amino-4,6-dideoxygalactose transaminase